MNNGLINSLTVIPPFSDIDHELVTKYFLENNFVSSFGLKQKAYYNIVRPILPIKLRQRLQKEYNSKISLKENFINDEFVNIIKKQSDFNQSKEKLYPENFKSALVLTHDVEELAGFRNIPKIIDVEQSLGFKSSWNIVPYKYPIDNGIINYINNAGHEIGIHGYNHDGKLYYSEKIFNQRVPLINQAINKYNAIGFRSPQVHRNLKWLQKLDIKYDASCFDYDPYQPFPGGTGSIWPFIIGKFVELPYTLPQDHTLFYVLQKKDIAIWKNKTNWLIQNYGIVLCLTHPDYLINESHFNVYKNFLIYLKSLKDIWHCLPKEIAEWWKFKVNNNVKKANISK